MLLLLPPSEGKAAPPSRGRSLDLDGLSLPTLNPTRQRMAEAVSRLCRGPETTAMAALGLAPGLRGALALNRDLLTAPTLPVRTLYTGVLYDALGLSTLPTPAARRATAWILVSSAMFGALRLSDRVPPYRLSPAARPPGLPTPTAVWKDPLAHAIPAFAGRRLIVDLRSTPYAGMWRPPSALAPKTVPVRVLHEATPGDPSTRSIVSHFNKATKGRLVRDLCLDGADPKSPEDFIEHLRALKWTAEPNRAHKPHGSTGIDVIVHEI